MKKNKCYCGRDKKLLSRTCVKCSWKLNTLRSNMNSSNKDTVKWASKKYHEMQIDIIFFNKANEKNFKS